MPRRSEESENAEAVLTSVWNFIEREWVAGNRVSAYNALRRLQNRVSELEKENRRLLAIIEERDNPVKREEPIARRRGDPWAVTEEVVSDDDETR